MRGAVHLKGEGATPTLAEEILTPGDDRVRALLVSGGNPASPIPDGRKVLEALRALDLLVVVEPFVTETTELADYVLPPKILYEQAELTFYVEGANLEFPYAQYTSAIVEPPQGSELADEGYIAWALARRMGARLNFFGVDMDMDREPSDDDFHAILASRGNVPLEELKRSARGGKIFDDLPAVVVLPPSGQGGRFEVMPPDVAAELRAFAASLGAGSKSQKNGPYPLLLISRRTREVANGAYRHFRSARQRAPFNPLSLHPSDLQHLGLTDGADCWVISDNGRIPAIVRVDETLKPGVVSMSHGFGWLADAETDYRQRGASTSLLISLDRDCDPLQAMPRMSGIRVTVVAR